MNTNNSHHLWRVRLIGGLVLAFLALIGVIITDINKEGGWTYWRALTVVFAGLSLGMSLYLRHHRFKESVITIWHEILHWLGLIMGVSIVSVLVHLGLEGRFVASLQVLTLLALATYLAGIYIDPLFLWIGFLLGLFVLGLSLLSIYLYVLIPVTILVLIAFAWYIKKKSHHQRDL